MDKLTVVCIGSVVFSYILGALAGNLAVFSFLGGTAFATTVACSQTPVRKPKKVKKQPVRRVKRRRRSKSWF